MVLHQLGKQKHVSHICLCNLVLFVIVIGNYVAQLQGKLIRGALCMLTCMMLNVIEYRCFISK